MLSGRYTSQPRRAQSQSAESHMNPMKGKAAGTLWLSLSISQLNHHLRHIRDLCCFSSVLGDSLLMESGDDVFTRQTLQTTSSYQPMLFTLTLRRNAAGTGGWLPGFLPDRVPATRRSAVGTASGSRPAQKRHPSLGPADSSADFLSRIRLKPSALPGHELARSIEMNADLLKQRNTETATDLETEGCIGKLTGH